MQRSSVSSDPASQRRTPPYPQHSEPPLTPEGRQQNRVWFTPLFLLMLTLLVFLALVFTSPDVQAPVSVFAQLFSMLFSLICTSIMLLRTEPGRLKWAWGCIALAQGLFVIGDATIIVLVNQPVYSATAVSLADLFFLPLSPLTAIGAILFPAAESTPAKQVRILLDASIIVGALLAVAVVFLIAPRIVSGTSNDLIFIGYPVADLTLILTLGVLLFRGVQSAYRPVFFWLILGMLCFVYADSAYNYFSLPGLAGGPTYTPGTFYIDIFWVVGAFSFSLAPLSMLRQRQQSGPILRWLNKVSLPTTLLRPAGLINQFFLLVLPVAVLVGLLLFINANPLERGTTVPLLLLTFLVMLLIISRQILTQRDLVDARIATERAQQLDSLKDQFITSVNHELRTPLMTMTGYIDILADPEAQATPEKQRQMLGLARNAGESLVHLVKSILDTRRIDQEAANFVPEVVNVQEALQVSISLIDTREADPTGRRLQIQVPGNLVVWGEPVRIQQVLTNLLSNAIKYSPPEMPIAVTARLVTEKNTRLLGLGATPRPSQHMVEITVRDWGLGIPLEQQDLLFRRFVRLPREIAGNIHGTGMGLYLCRVYIEAMGGRVWVASTGVEGEGSTFHVRLPVPVESFQPALNL